MKTQLPNPNSPFWLALMGQTQPSHVVSPPRWPLDWEEDLPDPQKFLTLVPFQDTCAVYCHHPFIGSAALDPPPPPPPQSLR